MVLTSRGSSAPLSLSLLLLALAAPVEAAARTPDFLPKEAPEPSSSDLLSEVESVLGGGRRPRMEARLKVVEDFLRPTFQALPKLQGGGLSAPTSRYALHRLFVQIHAWQVKGLAPAGETWDFESPTAALGDRAPKQLKALFEDRLAKGGLSLEDLAVLAASIERLIHTEAHARLQVVWDALGAPKAGGAAIRAAQADSILDAYMATYILGASVSDLSKEAILFAVQDIELQYPTFNDTKAWLRQVRQDARPRQQLFSFGDVAAVVEGAMDRYGHWQASECHAVKHQLATADHVGSGRVRLGDFYGMALDGAQWQFTESVDYLRQLGSLDETSPDLPKLLIANYVNSPTNCVASLEYYSVCCIDECESLLGYLEEELAAPTATPEDILAVVSRLSSASVPANRTLPAALMDRLEEVAKLHGGRVPLHGRLFAQWLHLAYPRECPYPHISGTTSPMSAVDWERLGRESSASQEEMLQHREASDGSRRAGRRAGSALLGGMAAAEELCAQVWIMEEELIADAGTERGADSTEQGAPLYASFLIGVTTSIAITGVRMLAALERPQSCSADTGAPAKRTYRV